LTKEGEVRWTTYSIFHGQERWKSEGIQIGGVRAARGVVGNWFDRLVNVLISSPFLVPPLFSSSFFFFFFSSPLSLLPCFAFANILRISRDHDPRGPAGPTAFWKLSDFRQSNPNHSQVMLHEFLAILDNPGIYAVDALPSSPDSDEAEEEEIGFGYGDHDMEGAFAHDLTILAEAAWEFSFPHGLAHGDSDEEEDDEDEDENEDENEDEDQDEDRDEDKGKDDGQDGNGSGGNDTDDNDKLDNGNDDDDNHDDQYGPEITDAKGLAD
jgi:hypothetical protein